MIAHPAWQSHSAIFFALSMLAPSTVSTASSSSIAATWSDLANVPPTPKMNDVSYGSGGMLFNVCCSIALLEAVYIDNGTMEFVPGQSVLHGDIDVFRNNPNPCTGAPQYTGYEASVPQVTVPYTWCAEKCPGWDRIEVNDINAWVQQILGYTLPAAIFCLNIPRRWQLTIPRQYFPRLTWLSLLSMTYKIPIMTILAVSDTILWLTTVLCLAGPMMLSGVYESVLDYKIIYQLSSTKNQLRLTFRQRYHLALILLIGNLDQDHAWHDSVSAVNRLPNVRSVAIHTDAIMGRKLRMLLQAQQNFASVIGIGVLFFITSFTYACLDLEGKIGLSITSHNLALGLFWMVVPHVAIVSNFTLTSAGSCTWDLANVENSAQYSRREPRSTRHQGLWQRIKAHFGLSDRNNSKILYHIAWPWDRGHHRLEWLNRFIGEYPDLKFDLERRLRVSNIETICFIWIPTLLMLLTPCALGCLISVLTPIVGVSCKSIILLLYMGFQLCLMILWQFNISPTVNRFGGPKWLGLLLRSIFTFLMTLSGIIAVGGTIVVDTGMTNNCLCYISMSQWLYRYTDPAVVIVLGPNINEGNYYSHKFWLSCGIAAAAFLSIMLFTRW